MDFYNERKILFKVGLIFYDCMKRGKNIGKYINFDVLLSLKFETADEADKLGNNSALEGFLERGDDGRVSISICSDSSGDLVDKIYWDDFEKYRCSIMKENSLYKLCEGDKVCIGQNDFEPFSEKFDEILSQLTDKNFFSLDCISCWVQPAFEFDSVPTTTDKEKAELERLTKIMTDTTPVTGYCY